MSDAFSDQFQMTRRIRRQFRCVCCGLLFPAVNSNAQYCSSACKVYAFRARRTHALPSAVSHAADPVLPLQWHEHADPGHESRAWHGTAIHRREGDGYTNATAMLQANGKLWGNYFRNDRTTEYITALATSLNLSPAQLVISTTTGPNHLRGTWIHPRLAVDLARWISPAFAVWMDGWFLESMQRPTQPLALAPTLAEGVHVVASDPRHANWLWMQAVENQLRVALMTQYPPTKGACWTGPAQQQQPFQLHLIAA